MEVAILISVKNDKQKPNPIKLVNFMIILVTSSSLYKIIRTKQVSYEKINYVKQALDNEYNLLITINYLSHENKDKSEQFSTCIITHPVWEIGYTKGLIL